jgi:ABC-type branched-subunit amino acid transport system substrate-binding protein
MLTAPITAYFSFPRSPRPHRVRRPQTPGIRPSRFPCALTLLFMVLALGSRTAQATEPEAPDEIVLGMSAVLTGVSADLGKNMQRGIFAGLERVNRNAGVNGRKLRLIALDDGYQPARAAINMRQLIEKEHVLALIGNVGTPTAIVAVPLANEQRTLLFAPFAGGPVLRNDPPDRYVINFRAGYAEETAAMIDALIDIGGLKPEEIAFFSQRNNSGYAMVVAALQRHGLKNPNAILHTVYEPNTLAVEGAVADLLTAAKPPRAVMVFATYGACAKFIRLCRDSDLNPIFLSVSFVGGNSLVQALGKTDAHVIVTQIVPYPLDKTIPIVREYQADLKATDPSASADFGDFEGYIAARILTLALAKIQGSPTREALVDALEGLGQFDLGLGEPLHLSRTEHQASHRVWPTLLREGQFVPFQWSDLKALLNQTLP